MALVLLLLLVLLHADADDGAVAVGVSVVAVGDQVGAFDVAVGVRVGAVAGVGDYFGTFDGAGKLKGVYFCKQTKQPLLCTCRPIDISTNIILGRQLLL